MSKNKISPLGSSWGDFEKATFTSEEIAASELRVSVLTEIIKARQEQGVTQKQLETLSGVSQPVIARLEKGATDPQLSTVIKVLAPLGLTLAVVPMQKYAE